MTLEKLIKKQLLEIWSEQPDIQVIETPMGKVININYSDCKICIDRIYNLIGEYMHVFVRLPHCDISFSDLEELYDIVYHSNLEYHRIKGAKNGKNSKNNKSANKTTEPKVHKVFCNS